MAARRLTRRRRAAAWAVTGPLGHLYGGVADWLVLAGRMLAARVRGSQRST
jgi:hypothetical protein